MTESLAGSPWGAIVAVIVGAVLGRCLTIAVSKWFAATDDSEPANGPTLRGVELAAIASALALWWWEVRLLGQVPAVLCVGSGTEVASEASSGLTLVCRYAAHLTLFWLLAAATWIDLRQRVIPDWITVPGVLAGLLCVWGWPEILLPVAGEVPRSFAAPRIEADVLGFMGGLRTMPGAEWLGAAPHVPGLLLALVIFAGWWTVCTEATHESAAPRWLEPRNMLLVLGLVAMVAAWIVDPLRFHGLQSALVGLTVSGGIVWAIRAGASRALGREAMGFGDVTLMAMIGAWLGWQACVLTFFLAAFIGLAHGLFQVVRHQESELPFGPSLCLAAAGVVVCWRPLWETVSIHFEDPGRLAAVVAAVVVLTAVTLFGWRLVRDRLAGS